MISGFPLFVVVFGVLFGRQLGPLFCLLFCSGGDSGVHVVFEVLLSNGVFCSGDGNSNKTWAFGEHCSGYTLVYTCSLCNVLLRFCVHVHSHSFHFKNRSLQTERWDPFMYQMQKGEQ